MVLLCSAHGPETHTDLCFMLHGQHILLKSTCHKITVLKCYFLNAMMLVVSLSIQLPFVNVGYSTTLGYVTRAEDQCRCAC